MLRQIGNKIRYSLRLDYVYSCWTLYDIFGRNRITFGYTHGDCVESNTQLNRAWFPNLELDHNRAYETFLSGFHCIEKKPQKKDLHETHVHFYTKHMPNLFFLVMVVPTCIHCRVRSYLTRNTNMRDQNLVSFPTNS